MATTDDLTANQKIQQQLAAWGLSTLTGVVQGYLTKGLSPDEQYLDLRSQPVYQERFKGNQGLLDRGLAPLTEAEYLSKEQTIDETARKYQLPDGFMSQAEKAKLIGGNVGGVELTQRLEAAKSVVTDGAMTGVLAYAQQNYGLGTGDLMAYFLDPVKSAPMLAQIANASQIGAAAARTGFGSIDTATAERVNALGISADQAASGFSQAGSLTGLTDQVGDAQGVTKDDLEKGLVEGNADATKKIQKAQDERKAQFAGGGTFASSNTGISGLGSAAV